ncbi:MAG: FkbM family methyltransferase [Steroidobacteraceae bacterium]
MEVAWIRGHHFLTGRLDASSSVVDLGAHRGEFSAELARRFGCRCFALEPVEELIREAPPHPRITVVPEAIAAADGPIVLHLKRNPEANSLLAQAPGDSAGDRTVAGTSWSSLQRRLGLDRVALLKVDIEGAELELLQALTPQELAAIEQLTVEFHAEALGGVAGIRQVVGRLRAMGFWAVRFSRGYGDVLFVNQAAFQLSLAQRLWLRHAIRNWLGFLRRARRWAGRAQ